MPTIYEDTRQQIYKTDKPAHKHLWWDEHGVDVKRRKLETGDYATDTSNVLVDTKRDVAEVAQNIGGRQHSRFKRECQRAQDAGCRLVVLVENLHGYTQISHVNAWLNSHCACCVHYKRKSCIPRASGKCLKHGTRKPIQGDRLARAMSTMSKRYGVRFEFCKPSEAARRICELLGVAYE